MMLQVTQFFSEISLHGTLLPCRIFPDSATFCSSYAVFRWGGGRGIFVLRYVRICDFTDCVVTDVYHVRVSSLSIKASVKPLLVQDSQYRR